MIRALLIFTLVTVMIALSSGASRDESSNRIRRVEAGLIPVDEKGQPTKPVVLADRMRHYGIPSVSIAVINEGKIEWARGYGVGEGKQPVTSETLFQACSLSKPIAGIAALQLVEENKLNLDEDVNQKLTSWKVPTNSDLKLVNCFGALPSTG